MKILLLDDDEFLLDMYAAKFDKHGHEVVGVKTVADGVEQLRAGTFDAVVLDMVLPGATGIDFLRQIKSESLDRGATLIVLSNQGSDEDIRAAKDAGAAEYIIKAQMIPSEVVSAVERAVGASTPAVT